jgi:hypothetical protein
MKTLIIDRVKFLNWYNDDIDFTSLVIESLIIDKVYTIKLEDLLDNVGYIPEEVLVEGQQYELDSYGDVDTSNVTLKFN